MRHHHPTRRSLGGGFDHMRDKGVISFGLRRQATMEALYGSLPLLITPFILAKTGDWRPLTSNFMVVFVFNQFGAADGIAPFDASIVHTCQNMFIFASAQVAPVIPDHRVQKSLTPFFKSWYCRIYQQRTWTTAGSEMAFACWGWPSRLFIPTLPQACKNSRPSCRHRRRNRAIRIS